jgi:hypothetical protein
LDADESGALASAAAGGLPPSEHAPTCACTLANSIPHVLAIAPEPQASGPLTQPKRNTGEKVKPSLVDTASSFKYGFPDCGVQA